MNAAPSTSIRRLTAGRAKWTAVKSALKCLTKEMECQKRATSLLVAKVE